LKRLIQLDADVARLDKSVEKIETDVRDHDKRLIRIENPDRSQPIGRPATAPLIKRSLARVP
jgi:hypothetical protein